MKVDLRRSLESDLAYITALERHPHNREQIGQWSDDQHRAAMAGVDRWSHWIIERDGVPAGYMIARDCRAQGAGVYLKRILVADKERGTGRLALAAFVERALVNDRADAVWLIVRNENARAQAVYRKLGFERFDPADAEARSYDAVAEAPAERCFRMRIIGVGLQLS